MTKSSLSILTAAAVVGAASAALTVVLMSGGRESAEADPGALAPDPEAGWAAGLDGLERRVDELERRLGVLELPAPTARQDAGGDLVTRAELEELLSTSPTAEATTTAAAPDLEARVSDALAAVRAQEAVERERRADQKRQRKIEAQVADWQVWLGLDDYQQGELQALFVQRDERNRELGRQWKEGGDPEVLGELKRTYHQEHQSALETLLTPAQLETYRDSSKGHDD